jgi:hypothetical protein
MRGHRLSIMRYQDSSRAARCIAKLNCRFPSTKAQDNSLIDHKVIVEEVGKLRNHLVDNVRRNSQERSNVGPVRTRSAVAILRSLAETRPYCRGNLGRNNCNRKS